MKRRLFRYERQKILFALTIVLIISVGIVIRDYDLPIISINPNIDYVTELLFVHTSEDKTFYNIAISYIAAYIFFVVQVYIPLCLDHKKGLQLLKTEIEKSIDNINLLILIISNDIERKDGFINQKNVHHFFIIEEMRSQIFKFTMKKSLWVLVNMVLVNYNKIINSPVFCYLDNEVCKRILSLSIQDRAKRK